ncbi:MAG: hypothetical protein OXG35_18340, partial [Acidobacteria bacterium]|nr:hypothetical protein [Acidobacteriota bacterium]
RRAAWVGGGGARALRPPPALPPGRRRGDRPVRGGARWACGAAPPEPGSPVASDEPLLHAGTPTEAVSNRARTRRAEERAAPGWG